MQWRDMERSENVEDRRGGGGGGLPIGGTPGSILLLLVVLVGGYFGVDLTGLLDADSVSLQQPSVRQSAPVASQDDELGEFSRVVLRQTEILWEKHFRANGKRYVKPHLVLYSGGTQTACGYGEAATGPFYCPADNKLYVDLSFYHDMQKSLGGGGDFALGYVLAHEVGHHVQNLLGISEAVSEEQERVSKREANRLSVLLELQADCFAGVWGNSVQHTGRLEQGDLDEALRTATAIGEDRLQRMSQGRVVPDSFTHGTSKQRYYWFKRGFDTGDPAQCNTFARR